MSWEDRDCAGDDDPRRRFGRPGGDWQGIRPTLDNPMTWSLRFLHIAGITVRVHVIFLIFVVVELLRSLVGVRESEIPIPRELTFTAITMASLFLIVLLHEFGHCIACRKVGGFADEILMWPLGGLAYCRPPNHWKAHLITVVGGPLVNVLICMVAGALLWLVTGQFWGVAVPNPFGLYAGQIDAIHDLQGVQMWMISTLYWVNALSLILLLFNLLPIFPFDGGRIAQALLWPRVGYVRSMRIAVWTGYFGAIFLGVLALVTGSVMLVMIAVFGGLTCYMSSRQLQFTEEFMGYESDDYASSVYASGSGEQEEAHRSKPTRLDKAAARQAERQRSEAEAVDKILEKISRQGKDSLTASERRMLRRATKRKHDQ